MENTLQHSEFNETNSTSFEEDDFAPIDHNWRRNYYRSVFRKRIKSYLLDYLTVLSFIIVLTMFSFLSGFLFGGDSGFEVFIVGYLLCLISYPIIVGIMESSKWKGFIGKRIMKIEISDNYGNSISFWRSLWRNYIKGITFLLCATLIGYFIQRHYYLKKGKFLHDYWSNTVIGERLKTV